MAQLGESVDDDDGHVPVVRAAVAAGVRGAVGLHRTCSALGVAHRRGARSDCRARFVTPTLATVLRSLEARGC